MDTSVDKPAFFARIKKSFLDLFWDKKFLNYTITGLVISCLNVFLLWLLIDVFFMSTVLSGFLVVGATFLIRYILLIFFKIF